MRGFISFEKACLAKAFSGKFWPIEKLSGGLAVLLLLVTKAIPLPEGVSSMLETDAPFYFVVSVFALTVFVGYMVAPYSLYKEQLDAKLALELGRKPFLNVFVGERDAKDVLRGGTSQTMGGRRQTSIGMSIPSALSIYCKNTGETKAKNCVARLVSAQQILNEGNRKLEIVESLLLPWSPTNPESALSKDIPPNEISRIWIAGITPDGHLWAFRDVNMLPVEYHRFFGEVGRYELVVQVDADNSPAIQVKLDIQTQEHDSDEPGLHKGAGQISILAQGSPTLPQIEIATKTPH